MTSRRKRWITFAAFAGLGVAALVWTALRIPFSSETLRSRLVAALADRLDSEVRARRADAFMSSPAYKPWGSVSRFTTRGVATSRP